MKAEEEKNTKIYLENLRRTKESQERTLASFTAERDVLAGLPAKLAGSKSAKKDRKVVESIIKEHSKKLAETEAEIKSCEEMLKK